MKRKGEKDGSASPLLLGLGIGVPIALAAVLVALILRPSRIVTPAAVKSRESSLATVGRPMVTATATVTVSPKARDDAQDPAPEVASTAPPQIASPSPIRAPHGSVVLAEWHDGASDMQCVEVMTRYENRSDTAVIAIRQSFRTMYTPKHKPGTYPNSVYGPVKTLTQDVGLQPYGARAVMWNVCAPELVGLQSPPERDGTDSFLSEIGAQPSKFHWTWDVAE